MKFTIDWLSEYVPVKNVDPGYIADRLTMLGLEVDSVEKLHDKLSPILVAKIIDVQPHPNADRLLVCKVDTGTETLTVVCGAANARKGLTTAIALPGTILPGGMEVKKAKIRGTMSAGMLCSAKELKISDQHDGIMELDDCFPAGRTLVDCLQLLDTMVEVDLTPNRADCASVIGIAREIAAVTDSKLTTPVNSLEPLDASKVDYRVEIKDTGLCTRYMARKITGVKIGPSPWCLQKRLLAVGMRPINNIVDVTNYVMLEYGQPLHGFDFRKLAGKTITVRTPLDSEQEFVTLDNTVRKLTNDTLLICDGEKPVAIAGVMGGLNSEVSEDTTEVLVESAHFDPVSIRRTARRLGLPSESSYRFERGVDPNGVDKALERAVSLMAEISGGRVDEGGIDLYPEPKQPINLALRVSKVCDLLGTVLSGDDIAHYLRSIEFDVTITNNETLLVSVPTFRVDIEREVDLVEEVARLVGFDNIPTTLPRINMEYPDTEKLRSTSKEISKVLLAAGFNEAINYSFVSAKHGDQLQLHIDDPRRDALEILNPISEDQAVMRTMLLPGLLNNVRTNISYQQNDVRLFELGKVFEKKGPKVQPYEKVRLAAVISGNRYPGTTPLYFKDMTADFYDIKGVAQSILYYFRNSLQVSKFSFNKPDNSPSYCVAESYLELRYNDQTIGELGEINKLTAKSFGIKQKVFFLEFDMEKIVKIPSASAVFKSLPRFPSTRRDIALLVPESTLTGDLLASLAKVDCPELISYDIFDVYQGKSIEKGFKSVALSVVYRSSDSTLNDETVDKIHEEIVGSLMSEFGGRYREGA